MANYKFEDFINFIGEQLKATPPKEDVEAGEIELSLDEMSILLSRGEFDGEFVMEMEVAQFSKKMSQKDLEDIASANFLGVNTGGCTFFLEDKILKLKATTSAGTTPQENWDWLNRLVSVAYTWSKELEKHENVSSLVELKEEPKPTSGDIHPGMIQFKAWVVAHHTSRLF